MLQCLIALPLIHTNFGIWGCYFRAKLVVQSWRVSHSTPWTLSTVPENIMDDFLQQIIISLNMGWNLLLSFDRERGFWNFFFFFSEPEGEITKNAGTAIPRVGPILATIPNKFKLLLLYFCWERLGHHPLSNLVVFWKEKLII